MSAHSTEKAQACQSKPEDGLVRSAGTIGGLTAASRILGFFRDVIIAKAFGTGLGAEAFVVSFKIPNLLRDLVGEGATNAAFVPILTDCRERKPAKFWALVNRLFVVMTMVLTLLTALGIVFAPFVVRLLAPGFVDSADPMKFPLTVKLTRMIFPYLLLIGLSALAMGVLNALREFKSSAFGPILLNLAMIAAGYFFEARYGPMALVIGVLSGGVLQLACQIPPLLRLGFKWQWSDSASATKRGGSVQTARFVDGSDAPSVGGYAGRIGRLLLPRALGSALYQINVFVDSILASFEQIVGHGGQSALYYSNRLFQLPLAIFGIAMAQAALPTFSSQMVRGERGEFRRTFSMTLGTVSFVVLPAAVGLAFLAEPIVRILFERGRFDAYSTQITSRALFFYAWGLVSCAMIKLFVNVFYAMQDTRTPVKTMAVSVALNVCLSLVLMRQLGIGGLALASSLSATINLALLVVQLRAKFGPFLEKGFWAARVPALAASALLGALAWAFAVFVLDGARLRPGIEQAGLLGFGILVLSGAYFLAARLFGDRTFARAKKHA